MADSTDERDPVEELAEEFFARRRRGERPTIAEYQAAHPQFAERIHQVFETLMLLEDLGGKSMSTDTAGQALSIAEGKLGDYRLIREIGRGGMGVVFEAMQESLDRHVALKIMVAPPMHDSAYLQRFEREAKTAGRLHHTNIVPVFGVGSEKGIHYFAMQFIAGQGLDRVLSNLRLKSKSDSATVKFGSPTPASSAATRALPGNSTEPATTTANSLSAQGKPLGASLPNAGSPEYFRWVAKTVSDAADALAYAHRQGVVHRDIKPANLLLDDGGAVWITDFGLARMDDADDLTATGQIVGTVRYMAPERFKGSSDASVDTYALGVTLYELLTLQPAYTEQNKASLIDRIQHSDPAHPRSVEKRVPRDLETIALKAIAKEPHRRYATAGDFADDLRNFLAGLPIAARRSSVVERTMRWCRRHPVEAGLVLALFFALTTGLAVSTSLYFRSENHRKIAEDNLEDARKANALAEYRLIQVNEQRNAAQENLKQAMAAVDEYFTKTSENKLLQTPGTQPLRRELLASALKYYQNFAEQQKNAPEFETEVAIAHYRTGLIAQQIATREEAIDAFQKSIVILRPLVAKERTSRRSGALAASLNMLGLRYLEVKKTNEGLALLEEALRIYGDDLKLKPGDLKLKHNIAQNTVNVGIALYSANKRTEAMAHYKTAEKMAEELVAAQPKDREFRQTLIRVCTNIGSVNFYAGQNDPALQYYERANRLQSELSGESPNDLAAQREVARTLNNLGTFHAQFENKPKALEAFRKSADIMEKVVAGNPKVADYRSAYCFALKMFASVLKEDGKAFEALVPGKRGIDEAQKLIDLDPSNVPLRMQLTDTLMRYAVIQEGAGQFSQALLTLDSVEAEFKKAGLSPKHPDSMELFGQINTNRSRILSTMGRSDEAKALALKAIAKYRELLTTVNSSMGRANLFATYCLLTKIERGRGNWPAALAATREGRKVNGGQPIGNVIVARHLVRTAEAMEKAATKPSPADLEAIIIEAIGLLRTAIKQGYRNDLMKDEAFRQLHNRPDFQSLQGPKP